jgi:hypothetical protein
MGNRDLSLGIKRPGYEADRSLPSSSEVKECVELYLYSPNTPSWRGAQLKKGHRGFILPSKLRPLNGLYFRFRNETSYSYLTSPMHATWPTHLILLDFITLKISREEWKYEAFHYATFMCLLSFELTFHVLWRTQFNIRCHDVQVQCRNDKKMFTLLLLG